MKDMAENEPGGARIYSEQHQRSVSPHTPRLPARQAGLASEHGDPMSPTTVEGAGDTPYPPGVAENGYSEDSMDNSYDAPLDFSMKGARRDSDSGEVSETGNFSDGGHSEGDRALNGMVSPSSREGVRLDSRDGMRLDTTLVKEEPGLDQDEHHSSPDNGERTRSPSNIGEPQLALPGTHPGGMPMFAGSLPGTLPNGVMGSFPFMLDPRANGAGRGGQGGKGGGGSTRPFKAYPKDPLSIPLGGYYGLPSVLPFSGLDPAAVQAMGMGSEELLNQYRMYAIKAQEEALRAGKAGQGGQQPALSPLPPSGNQLQHSPNSKYTTSESSSKTPSTSPLGMPASPASSLSPVSPLLLGSGRPSVSRKRPRTLPDEQKDEAYWERRRKNNEAAKRSRDARRAKEDEIAIRAAFLEQENLKLRVEVAALKNETAKLRCMLYNS